MDTDDKSKARASTLRNQLSAANEWRTDMNERNLIVEDVRRIRHKISARFSHDTDKYVAHLRKLEVAETKRLA